MNVGVSPRIVEGSCAALKEGHKYLEVRTAAAAPPGEGRRWRPDAPPTHMSPGQSRQDGCGLGHEARVRRGLLLGSNGEAGGARYVGHTGIRAHKHLEDAEATPAGDMMPMEEHIVRQDDEIRGFFIGAI